MGEMQKWQEILIAMAGEDMPCYCCGTMTEFSESQFCIVCHKLVCQICWHGEMHNSHCLGRL